MKKTLAAIMIMAILIGFGTVAASADTEEPTESVVAQDISREKIHGKVDRIFDVLEDIKDRLDRFMEKLPSKLFEEWQRKYQEKVADLFGQMTEALEKGDYEEALKISKKLTPALVGVCTTALVIYLRGALSGFGSNFWTYVKDLISFLAWLPITAITALFYLVFVF